MSHLSEIYISLDVFLLHPAEAQSGKKKTQKPLRLVIDGGGEKKFFEELWKAIFHRAKHDRITSKCAQNALIAVDDPERFFDDLTGNFIPLRQACWCGVSRHIKSGDSADRRPECGFRRFLCFVFSVETKPDRTSPLQKRQKAFFSFET